MHLQKLVILGILLNFATLYDLVRGQTYEKVSSLRSALLASYDKDVIPISNQSEALNINLTLYLYGLPAVDPVNGALTMAVMMICEWYDEKMTWTPSNYNGVQDIYIPSSDVWTPYLTIANPIQMATLDQDWMPVRYSYDGHAYFTPGNVVECSCKFYMKYRPFDKQVCTLEIFPYGYMVDRVTLSVPGTVANTDFYKENPEWNLVDDSITYTIDNSLGNSQVKFYIRIMRQPEFYTLTVIMPIVGIGKLTCLIFVIPTDSGDRLGYAITVFLTLAVFLTVTSEDLPKTSDPTPIICMLILCSTIISMASVVMVILNAALYFKSETEPIPAWGRILVRIAKCHRCGRGKVNDVSDTTRPVSTMTQNGEKGVQTRIKVQEVTDEKSDKNNGNDITWKDVCFAIDRILIIALVFIIIIPSTSIVIYMSAASDFVY